MASTSASCDGRFAQSSALAATANGVFAAETLVCRLLGPEFGSVGRSASSSDAIRPSPAPGGVPPRSWSDGTTSNRA